MDNFRRPQRSALRKGSAVDGFLRAPSKTPAQKPRQTIGNFRQTEGFKASPQPVVPSNSFSLPKPQPGAATKARQAAAETKKRRFLGRFRRNRDKPRNKWALLAQRTAIAFCILLLVGGGYIGAQAYMKSRKVLRGGGSAAALQANVSPSLLNGEGDGRVNILLLGRGGAGHDGPDLTDTIVIASIDPVHHEAALLSIPRDFWVKPSGGYGYTKINSIYANAKYAVQNGKKIPNQDQVAENAGEDAIKNTIQDTFGIPIHYHVMIDFEAFREAIDTVGGVDINVKQQVYDPTVAWENHNNPLIAAVGQQHFNGAKALLYVRSRHGSPRGDFDRSERQREVLSALKDKVLTAGTYGNPLKISQLINAFGNHVQSNFSSTEVMRLYSLAKQTPTNKISSVDLVTPPNDLLITGASPDGQSIVMPKAGIGNYADMQSYIRNTLKDSYIKDENASIMVLNGTSKPGLANSKATELRSFGYNVTTVGDAPTKDYTQTLLIDRRSGAKKYTQHYLENRLNVKATSSLPPGVDAGTADFVIILGQ